MIVRGRGDPPGMSGRLASIYADCATSGAAAHHYHRVRNGGYLGLGSSATRPARPYAEDVSSVPVSDASLAPTISVVIATWNAVATLEATLHSAFGQGHPGVEVIVIDGGSTDGTVDLIQRFDGRIAHWESEPDRGVYHAWNKALDHVNGDWVCFLGADDRFATPEVIGQMAPSLLAVDGNVRVVYGSVHVVDSHGHVQAVVGSPWEEAGPGMRQRMTLPNPATFYHRSLFDIHGRFSERFRITGDYEFLLRELLEQPAVFVPDVLVVLMDEGGLSSDPRQRTRRLTEIATARYLHGLTRVPPAISPMVLKARLAAALERAIGPSATEKVRQRYRSLTGRGSTPSSPGAAAAPRRRDR